MARHPLRSLTSSLPIRSPPPPVFLLCRVNAKLFSLFPCRYSLMTSSCAFRQPYFLQSFFSVQDSFPSSSGPILSPARLWP